MNIESEKKYQYNIFYNEIVLYIIDKLKNENNSFQNILSIIAHQRYYLEYNLDKLYPSLRLDFNLDKFGRCRDKNDSHGRKYIYKTNEKHYYPLAHKMKNKDELIFTAIFEKYKLYENKVKNYFNSNSNNYLIKEPLFDLLIKSEHKANTIKYENIDLSTIYYEFDDIMINNLKNINIENREIINNVNLYRAIYHSPTSSHLDILNICNSLFISFYKSSEYELKKYIIIKLAWLLSHASLYERGSASITEILISSMFSILENKNIVIYNQPDILFDIEAMLLDFKTFQNKFDNLILYKPNLLKEHNLPIKKINAIEDTGTIQLEDINYLIELLD